MNCPRESCFKCLASSWWRYFSVETSGGETKQEEVGLQGWVIQAVLSLSTSGLAHCCGQPWGEEPSSSTVSHCHDDIMSAHVTGTKSPWARLLNPWAEMNLSFLRFHLWCALFQRNKVTSTTSYTKNHYFASLRVDPDHHIDPSPLHAIITTKKALPIVQHLLSMDYSHSNELDNNYICKIPPTVGVVCFFMMYGINFSSLCLWDQVFLYWVIFLFSKSTIIPPSHEKAKQSSSQPSWLLVENPQAWHLVCSTIHAASFSI